MFSRVFTEYICFYLKSLLSTTLHSRKKYKRIFQKGFACAALLISPPPLSFTRGNGMCGLQGFMWGKVAKRWALNRKLRSDPPHVWVSNVSGYSWVAVGGGILRCALCMFRFPMPWRWHCAWDSASSLEGRLLCAELQKSGDTS